MQALLWISGGAVLGATLRWGVGLWLNPLFSMLSFGTLIANLIGCFMIGMLVALFWQCPQINYAWKLFLVTGFLGSLTPFSSFSAEVVELFFNDKWLHGLGVLALHLFGCLAMTALGIISYRLLSHFWH